jgi:hypothetical protein
MVIHFMKRIVYLCDVVCDVVLRFCAVLGWFSSSGVETVGE